MGRREEGSQGNGGQEWRIGGAREKDCADLAIREDNSSLPPCTVTLPQESARVDAEQQQQHKQEQRQKQQERQVKLGERVVCASIRALARAASLSGQSELRLRAELS